MSNDTTPYFFPDPYGTGEAVSIEATSLEDALKRIQERAPKLDGKSADVALPEDARAENPSPATKTSTDTPFTDTSPTKDSAPAPEADESLSKEINR
jgi:hypothetical protein